MEVAGESITLDRKLSGKQEATITFTLKSEQEVIIKVTAAEPKAFSVGATTVTLNYDFAKANSLITAELSKASNTIKDYTLAEYDHTVWNREEAAIHSILDNYFVDENADAYENAYVKYRLWETLDIDNNKVLSNNQILIDLKSAWKKSADLYKDAIVAKYNKQLEDIKDASNYKDAGKTVQDKVADELTAIQTAIDAISNTSTDGDLSEVDFTPKAQAVDNAISTFNNALNTATTNVAANEAAHTRVNTAADAAKGTYLVDLGNALDGTKYAHVRAYGNKAISKLFEELTTVKNKNDQSYARETAARDEAARNAEIAGITTRLQSTYTDYAETLKTLVDGFESQYDGVKGYPDAIKEQYGDSIYNLSANKTLVANLTNSISAVRNAIEAAQTGTNEDCQALKTLDLTDLIGAVESAKNALDNSCNLIKVRVEAEQHAAAVVVDLKQKFNAAVAAVGELNYDYENQKANRHDRTWSSGISRAITTFENKVNSKKAAVTPGADSFYTSEVGTTQNDIENSITEFQAEFTAAATNFNEVNAAVNEAQAKLDAVKARIADTPVWKAPDTGHTTQSGINYKQNVETAQGELDAIKGRMTATRSKNNKSNTDAVKALQFTEKTTVENILQGIEDNYASDSTALQQTLDAEALQAQKDAIQKKWNDLDAAIKSAQNDYSNGSLGKDAEALNSQITDLSNAITNEGLKDKVDAAVAAEDASSFGNVKDRLDYYTELMDSLQKKIDLAKIAKKANDDAKSAIDEAVSNLNWNSGAVIRAAGTSYTEGQNDEKERVDALIAEINEDLSNVANDESEFFSAFTLADHKAALLDSISNIKDKIAAATTTASELKTNYEAYTSLVDVYKASFVNAPTVIDNAKSAAIARDPAAGQTYYADQLIEAWKTEASDLLGTITANYKDNKYGKGNFSTDSKNEITKLVDKINGLETKGAVTTNHDVYDKEGATGIQSLKSFEDYVEDHWKDRMNELATKDQSSKLPERQRQMNSLLSDLNAQRAKDKASYESGVYGQYGQEGVNNKSTENTDRVELQRILDDLNSLVNQAVDSVNYKKDIDADNSNMWKIITNTKNDAQKAYKDAIDYVDAFKALKSTELKKVLADKAVTTAYETINREVYPMATDINKDYSTAWTEYSNVKSPTIFDRDSAYTFKFRQYTETINTDLQAFVDAVKNALDANVKSTLTGYQTQIASARSQAEADYNWKANGYTSGSRKADYKSIFKPLEDKVVKALDIIANDTISRQDYTDLDNILIGINDPGFDALLNADIDSAAKADVIDQLLKAEAEVKAANEGDTKITDGTLDAYNANDKVRVEQARAAYDGEQALNAYGNEKYTEIKDTLTNYFADNAYKTFNTNNKAYKDATDEIQKRQTQLDNALKSIANYACIEEIKKQTASVQDAIDNLKAQADAYNTATPRDKDGLDGVKTSAQALSATISNIFNKRGNLFEKELDYLNGRINELTAEYNVFASDTTRSAADISAEKSTIDGIKRSIETAKNRSPRNSDDLQKLEKSIKDELDKLANANGALLDNTRKALEKSRGEVDAKVTYGSDDAEVVNYVTTHNPKIVSEYDALKQSLDSLKDAIKQSSIFDRDRIQAEIDALDKRADALKPQIETAKTEAQRELQAIANAWQNLTTYISDLRQKVANNRKELNETFSNADAKSDRFTNKYKQITDDIDAEEAKINEWKADGSDPREFTKGNINSSIDQDLFEIKNLAAYRQLVADLGTKDPSTPYGKAEAVYNNLVPRQNEDGTPIPTGKDLFTQSDYNTLVTMWQTDIEGAYSTILSDISHDWQAGESYDDRDASNGINYENREAAIDRLKSKIDEFMAFYDKNVTKPDLNRDGKANSADVTVVADAVKTNAEKTTENARLDINGDGVIDIFDIQEAIKRIHN